MAIFYTCSPTSWFLKKLIHFRSIFIMISPFFLLSFLSHLPLFKILHLVPFGNYVRYLPQCSLAVKRHYDHSNSYKKKTFSWSWLTVSKV